MKALITGSAGFAGQHLAEYLLSLGIEVWGTKLPGEKHRGLQQIKEIDMDVTNPQDILEVLEQCRPDYIFHLAAQSSVAFSWQNPVLTMDVNLNGTINLLNAIRMIGINPRVLLVGSGEEYGPVTEDDIPIKENTMLNPQNPMCQ